MRPFLPALAAVGLASATMAPECDSCFVRGTRITTEAGERAIEDVQVSGESKTENGLRCVFSKEFDAL